MSEIKTCTLVKVQLAIDIKLARETGKVYADVTNPELLVYDAKHKHVFQGRDDTLRAFMLSALGGAGYMKAYLLAEWDADQRRWVIDYAAGFQLMQGW